MNSNREAVAKSIERWSNRSNPEYMKLGVAVVEVAGFLMVNPIVGVAVGVAAVVDGAASSIDKARKGERGTCRLIRNSTWFGPKLAEMVRGRDVAE